MKEYCDSCNNCSHTKSVKHKPYGVLQSLPPPRGPFTDLTMDFIVELPPSTRGKGQKREREKEGETASRKQPDCQNRLRMGPLPPIRPPLARSGELKGSVSGDLNSQQHFPTSAPMRTTQK